MNIEAIETEEGVKLVFDIATREVAIEGLPDAVKRAEARLREDALGAEALLKARQGISDVVEHRVVLNWSADNEVSKQQRYGNAHSEYHKWSASELARLRDFLQPGDSVEPVYAFSLHVRRGNQTIHYRKDGTVL